MATTQELCDICEQRHVTKSSTFWCPECEQAFCDDCNAYHGFSKLSKLHVTVSIQDHSALSSSISQIRNTCIDHNEQCQLVCQAHDELLCLKCIEKHDGCKGIIPISKVIENVKKSSLFQETQQSLNDINRNIEMLQKFLKKQQGSIKHQEETILSQISDTKKKINDHLNKLEKKIRNEVSEITAKLNNVIIQTLQILESKNGDTNNAEQQLKDLDMYATDIQAYLGLRKISSEATTSEAYLQSLIGDNILNESNLLFQIDNKIDNVIDGTCIITFGSVKVQQSPFQLSLITHKNKQAQLRGTRLKCITNIKLRLIKTTETEILDTKGLAVLPSGNIALTDFNYEKDHLCIFNSDWKMLSQVTLTPALVFGVTYIDNETVAITSYWLTRKGVSIIDIDTGKVMKFIPTNRQCNGIKHYNGALFVCVYSEGIFRLNPQDGVSTAIVRSDLPLVSYIEIFDNKIYYTNYQTKTLNCCDMNGKAIWTFRDKNTLKDPLGISVDDNRNVYVACSKLHRVMVISPDGQKCRQLLSRDDGLESPYAIHFDHKSKCLLILNESQTVFTYEIIN